MQVRIQGTNTAPEMQSDLSDTGEVLSFWLSNNKKNLLHLFFQLPSQAVRVGDTWPVRVDFVDAGKSFTVKDSARTNQVRLVGLEPGPAGDTVAFLEYQVVEWVKGTLGERELIMSVGFVGRGQFLVNKGAWKQLVAFFISQSGVPVTEPADTAMVYLTPKAKKP